MIVLVTGGAGYIGSHVCKTLAQAGHTPVVYDNLCTGFKRLVQFGAFVEGDIRDTDRLISVMREHRVEAVIHMAAHIATGESVEKPWMYYQNNVVGSLSLLEAMRAAHVPYIVFSSTAGIYGIPAIVPIPESLPLNPISPYGAGKRMVEEMLQSYKTAGVFSYVALRYFNAAGADPEGKIGCLHPVPQNLIPILLDVACGVRPSFSIFGTDYPTSDGTALRDYIHVMDLAEAHIAALDHLVRGGDSRAMNLGTGSGYSVREVHHAAERITGRSIPALEAPRRAGDAPVLIADARLAHEVLGWQTRCSGLDYILETAWRWRRDGFAA